MIILPVNLLSNEWMDFDGEEPASFLELEPTPELELSAPVRYRLRASLVSGGVLVEGKVSTRMRAQCGRCLEMFEAEVRAPEVCHYYENVGVVELDVSDDIREDLLLGLPANPICGEACRGLCHQCGANLNQNPCPCHEEKSGNLVWGELDNLKFEK